ncbi:ribosomal protein subunit S27 [Schizosaccharomyces japonicus yFS275]|uniref:Ribosomal protein subunit S27 n=1 Tax=Schizosaccharomyces japonicus (strain yFS275 / FY16936) TaxID=402676 RepID=B6K382_SCHJY|nr:ribosomal protein subunit S27 [Schizosaccharomyces japonicus yFS275]EEB07939.2 ribosomal protein subunit S27 [Schizosaccharomyces japonicus yFS275]
MALDKKLLLEVAQVSSEVFGTAQGTGSKAGISRFLRKKLRGPVVANYYGNELPKHPSTGRMLWITRRILGQEKLTQDSLNVNRGRCGSIPKKVKEKK